MTDIPKAPQRLFLFAVLIGALFFFTLPVHAYTEIPSSTLVLYHFENNANDTQGKADINIGSGNGSYVDMLTNLNKAIYVVAPTSFNSSNTISLNGDTEATLGAWVYPTSTDQNQVVPFGTEAGDLFQQLSGRKIRCDLPDFNDYNGTTVMSTSTPTFVACVYKNSHTDLYINGAIDGAGVSSVASVSETASQVHVGNWNGAANYTGDLDDAFIVPVALSSSTLRSIYNSGLGDPICATTGCGTPASTSTPSISSGTLAQYTADGSTTLGQGSSTSENSIVFSATLISSTTDALELQVQVSTSTSFTNVTNATSGAVSSGNTASTTVDLTTLYDGSYYWRGKVLDLTLNESSSWQQIGTVGAVDFVLGGRPTGYQISDGSVLALYHFDNNTSDTIGKADLTVGTSGGGYVNMLSNLNQAKDVEAPSSFNSANTLSLSGDTEATIGGWILPTSTNQDSVVPFGTEDGDLFQQINGYKIRCDLPDFNDYNGSIVISTTAPTFVVCVYKNSHTDMYINGVKDGAGVSSASSISETASKVDVGNWEGGAKWTGDLDEAFVMSKALSTSTIASLYNGGVGLPICLTAGCTRVQTINSSTLAQYQANASDTIPEEGTDPDNSVVFKATMQATVSSSLEVEVKQAGLAFSNTPNATSTALASGTPAIATFSGLLNRSYHWQARANASGTYSAWQPGGTSTLGIDFRVASLNNAASEYFDGASSLSYSAASDTFSATDSSTIEFWYRTPVSSTVEDFVDTRQVNASSNYEGYLINWSYGSGLHVFVGCDSSTIDFNAATALAQKIGGPNDLGGIWHQVAITKGTGTTASAFNLYFDGASQSKDSITSSGPISGNCDVSSSTDSIRFGSDVTSSSTQNPLTGNLDEVRIWDTKRSADDVSSTWNQEVAATSTNLVGLWRFNATSTDIATNKSTSGETGEPTFASSTPFGHFLMPFYPAQSIAVTNDGKMNLYYDTSGFTIPSEMATAISNWNSLGEVTLATSTYGAATVIVSAVDSSSLAWDGATTFFPDSNIVTLQFNDYYVEGLTYDSDARLHVAEHELGHALGLGHSYIGNVMNYYTTEQTAFGGQDLSDYHFLWGGY